MQSRNRKHVKYYEFNGSLKTLGELAKIHNLDYKLVYNRINKLGLSLEESLKPITRKKIYIEIDGKQCSLKNAATKLNTPFLLLRNRLRSGWSLEKIVNTPVNTNYRSKHKKTTN